MHRHSLPCSRRHGSAPGRCLALAFSLALLAACSPAPTGSAVPEDYTIAPGAAPVTTTFLSFQSDPGEFLGQGETHRYAVGDGGWAVAPLWDAAGVLGVTVSVGANNGDGVRVSL